MYRKRGTGKVKIKCQECKRTFDVFRCYLPRRKYCSQKCKNKAHRKRMSGKDFGGRIVKKCKQCGKEFKTYKSLNLECCSNNCRHKLHRKKISGEKHPLWVGGKNSYRGCDWKYIRLLVLQRDNNKCQICGKTKRLHIHHKNPYRILKDNSLENLITLCMSCHMKEERKLCQN